MTLPDLGYKLCGPKYSTCRVQVIGEKIMLQFNQRRYGPMVPKTFSAIALAAIRKLWVVRLLRVSWWSGRKTNGRVTGCWSLA